MAAFTSQEQRSYIKIEVQHKKSAKKIFNALQEACDTYALSYVQVTRWVKELKDGRDSVKDNHRPGRNVTATDSYSTVQVKELLNHNRRISCEVLAQELEICVGSVHTIIPNNLKMRKVSARWVPHRLTSEQAERRLNIATNHLSRFSKEGRNFLSRIVAIDETWVRSYDPELKRQSAEWHTPNSPLDGYSQNLRC
jgi:histone-lysine N-methyltransferase SETMAR